MSYAPHKHKDTDSLEIFSVVARVLNDRENSLKLRKG
jgi:hypothetical protein